MKIHPELLNKKKDDVYNYLLKIYSNCEIYCLHQHTIVNSDYRPNRIIIYFNDNNYVISITRG